MQTKSKTQLLKESIIENSIKLFYENGYTATRLEDIAKLSGTSKQQISYHFGSKSLLAQFVDYKISKDVKNYVSFKLYKGYDNMLAFDLQLSTAIELRLICRLQMEDPCVMRFYNDRMHDDFSGLLCADFSPFYENHNRIYHLKLDNTIDEVKMISLSSNASTLALMVAYSKGEIKCDYEKFIDYCVGIPFELMHVSSLKIRELNEQSKKIIEKMNFEIAPYFKIK